MIDCALVVGHSAGKKGSVSAGISEWDFNLKVALEANTFLNNELKRTSMIFLRNDRHYEHAMMDLVDQINAVKPKCIVSLHYNALGTNTRADGCTSLYFPGSKEGERLASSMCSAFENVVGLRNRGPRATMKSLGSYVQLYILTQTKAPATIIEPFFGTNREDRQKAIKARNNGDYSFAVAKGIHEWLMRFDP
jgi:N-acetylmuramoyl-L-alanine amidase